ncbi:multifunctional oxoglutarate decarboxylase/oxoglutarate dehydrogenase thiamine pyrophosphate-binding subunit/dihydrolipoyllysine-residue succinyltransferase subunit [Candidatus Poriferisocius sp.]|uniref:multifunctional oxoglutarate decarboxylase/oxoglutarate dehydrogenase thiamine pyrophosphate-binding subunit/dihydrolipoyllysine-residue succinyltransferase subunit n=1 Tax=Candidatus Poriferisocius sp. TaxID=3101276 RepID=UPI003B51F88B
MTTDNEQLVGQNAWLVDEMHRQYLADPASVSESWQDFFSDYRPDRALPTQTAPAAGPQTAPDPPEKSEPLPGDPLRGAAARIARNMEASLAVPTATSFREVPARLLEVNRQIINGYLGRTGGRKVSYTHLIAYAVVQAIAHHMPVMNSTFADAEGGPRVVRHPHVGLGIAVDVEKSDGSRSLLVPCIPEADTLDFPSFVDLYYTMVRKVRANDLSPDDFAGVTVSITNPGTLGTLQSVPRLMPGQGVIVGLGTIDYPTAYQAADSRTLADLGVSKVITLSSTYDHRIIQGAESGMFLGAVHELLLGKHDFYVDIFREVGVPYHAVSWRPDILPLNREQAMITKQVQVNAIINMHRMRGHLIADLDPLSAAGPVMHAELDPATYGLTIWDLDREFLTTGFGGIDLGQPDGKMPLGDILHVLRNAYCRTVGVEYMHIQEPDEKRWIQNEVEGMVMPLALNEKLHILDRLNAAEALERFLDTKYVGQKRFGIEGAESAIVVLDAVLGKAADLGMASAIMGMAHRGRLNVLVNIVGKEYGQLFGEFEGNLDESSTQGSGDVKYHLGMTSEFNSMAGNQIQVELAANPSHLEAVNPVVEGMVRARLDHISQDHPEHSPVSGLVRGQAAGEDNRYPVLPLLVHGDAAFAGQGVVSETLNLSLIQGYRTGGTIHLVINNQVGFTTTAESARSSYYCTDVAKMIQAPIFHVNGDDPEACARVANLALAYRNHFHKDVVIDMWCYRRQGHNEADDPSYTQPEMYRRIESQRSVRKLYVESLVKRGDITLEEAEQALDGFRAKLQEALEGTRDQADAKGPGEIAGIETAGKRELHLSISGGLSDPTPLVPPPADTTVSEKQIKRVFEALTSLPEEFVLHPKLARQFDARDAMMAQGMVDWGLAEAMAFGTLLDEGTSIRLAGQDSRRGTFSHRHSTLVCNQTAREHRPLAGLARGGAKLWVYDSLLSEYAALGFEYGYSVGDPDALVLWEAQFGDFVNGAQIIIDQFVMSAEDKWDQRSGLVMLLPHGFEGQGPEHSSGRIERFLQSVAEDNIRVANLSTSAQYFHLLRDQAKRRPRNPLVLFTPKSLLRHRDARSPVSELAGAQFSPVLGDPGGPPPDQVAGVVLASGKICHEVLAERDRASAAAAVLRIEQLYPWPASALAEALACYPKANKIIWLQEEPQNMGPWNYVKGHIHDALGDRFEILRASRSESSSPATGSAAVHAQEQSELVARTVALADSKS